MIASLRVLVYTLLRTHSAWQHTTAANMYSRAGVTVGIIGSYTNAVER